MQPITKVLQNQFLLLNINLCTDEEAKIKLGLNNPNPREPPLPAADL